VSASSVAPAPRSGVVIGIDGCDYEIEDLVPVAVAADLLGESVETVRKRVASGELAAVKVGAPPADPTRDRRRIRIPLPAIVALLRPIEGVQR
jgi:hypothetical protein